MASGELPRSPGHAFYDRLNALLAKAGFDHQVEGLCQPHNAEGVRRGSIPPGVYFRMPILVETVLEAQINLVLASREQEVEEVVADKGYHKAETLAQCTRIKTRTYIPESRRKRRKWEDKPEEWHRATGSNRRRVRGRRSKRLQRKRSELVERSFAHVCETGGARRTWIRGLEEVQKRYKVQAAAFHLGVLMRVLFGVGKPRRLQAAFGALCWLHRLLEACLGRRGGRRDRSHLPAAA